MHCQLTHLTKSWPEGLPNSQSKQHKLSDPGLARLTSTDPTDGGLQADNDEPVLPRCKAQEQWETNPYGSIGILHYSKMTSFPWCLQYLGWPMYLPSHHFMCAHGPQGEYSVRTLYSNHCKSAQLTCNSWHWWEYHPCWLCGGFFRWGEWTKGYLVWVQLPHWRNQKNNSPQRSCGCLGSTSLIDMVCTVGE